MSKFAITLVVLLALPCFTGCGEHDCEFTSEAQKQALGDVAGMTKGAAHCFVTETADKHVELAASWYGSEIDTVAAKYEAWLTEKGWEVKVEPHEGKRANGKPLTGKRILARKDGRQFGTLVYELGDGIIDTSTMEIPTEE